MRGILFGLVFIAPPFIKKWLLRIFLSARIEKNAHIGWFSAVIGSSLEMGHHSVIRPFTLINLDGEVKLDSYSEISSFCLIYGSSSLSLGQGSYVGPQCLINVDEEVAIGKGSALGARVMIFTHGSFFPYTEGYWVKLSGVALGDRVWCAAGVFIHPGVEIGSDTFVNSMSVVTQSIPAGSVAEGNPAHVVYPMDRLRRKMSPRHVDLALIKILKNFCEIGLKREFGIIAQFDPAGMIQFDFRKVAYLIKLIPSTHESESESEVKERPAKNRVIAISNQPDIKFPAGIFVFKVPEMLTPYTHDRIHTALRLFMLRYYGMRFLDENLPH
jgi:acetyltransferase-like isoleucine patch superfamily enzyme